MALMESYICNCIRHDRYTATLSHQRDNACTHLYPHSQTHTYERTTDMFFNVQRLTGRMSDFRTNEQ